MKCLRVGMVWAFLMAVGILASSAAVAYDTSGATAYPKSADEAIAGALANVKSRYRAKLDRLGLTESYFDETSGICDLMLLDVGSWTKYQIVYYRATGQIEWPRIMPKGVAEDLMQDRLIIHGYKMSLEKSKAKMEAKSKGEAKSNSLAKTVAKPVRPKRPKPPPVHKEYVPTAEEQAAMDDMLKNAREATAEYEKKRNKPPVAESSDQRQMGELKRKGVSGDEIASRFGIESVKQYNKSHPESPIRTSKHSKPGAPGFSW